jgi:hypothetical protein
MTKTCGECKHYKERFKFCRDFLYPLQRNSKACVNFEKEIISNGDKIRQMSNEELARKFGYPCPPIPSKHCKGIDNEQCTECWLNWLNAPAESEGK